MVSSHESHSPGLLCRFVRWCLAAVRRGSESAFPASADYPLQHDRLDGDKHFAFESQLLHRHGEQRLDAFRAKVRTASRAARLVVGLAVAGLVFQLGGLVRGQVNFFLDNTSPSTTVNIGYMTWSVTCVAGPNRNYHTSGAGGGYIYGNSSIVPWNFGDGNSSDVYNLTVTWVGGTGSGVNIPAQTVNMSANGGGGYSRYLVYGPNTIYNPINFAGNNQWAGEQPTNNTGSITVNNNTDQPILFTPETASGIPAGAPVLLAAGGSASVPYSFFGLPSDFVSCVGQVAENNLFTGYTNTFGGQITGSNGNYSLPLNLQTGSDTLQTNGNIIWSSNTTVAPSGASIVFDPTVNNTLQAGINGMMSQNKLILDAAINADTYLNNIANSNRAIANYSNYVNVTLTNNITVTGGGTTNIGGGTSSNVWVMNWPTNFPGSTNSMDTNPATILAYLQATNLDSTTNDTWSPSYAGYTNQSAAASDSAAASSTLAAQESFLTGWLAGLTGPMQDDVTGVGDMTVTFYGYTLDFNPMHDSRIAGIFGYAKQLIMWLLALFYMLRVADDSFKVVEMMNAPRGTVPVGATVARS